MRLAPLSIAELLAIEYPDNTVIGGDVLDVGGLMLVVGPTSVGKSYLLLQIAMHLATGTAVVGQWAVPRPFCVYLVQAEIGRKRFQSRVGKLWRSFASTQGQLWLESPYDLKLDTAVGLAALEAIVVEKAVEVLLIDPLRPFHSRNENASEEMQRLFDSFLRLQFKYDVAIVLAHHDRKPSAEGWGKSIYETRGNTIITDRPDTVLRIKAAKAPGVVEAVWEKLRNGDALPPTQRWAGDRTTGLFQPLPTKPGNDDLARDILAAGSLPLSELAGAIAESGGITTKAAYSVIDGLASKGVLRKEEAVKGRKLVTLV